jgi:two-component system, chemotaxis family, chemotaxis protein CheY
VSGADTGAGGARKGARDLEAAERQGTDTGDAPEASTGEPHQSARQAHQLILIAEDEQPIAEALAMIIEDAGYEAPLIAAHGRQAQALVRTHRPALIITDLMMPLMDGAELIAAVRADAALDSHRPPPIVLMTAAGMRRAREAQADALLRKPFDLREVEALLLRFLGPPTTKQAGGTDP